MVFRGKRGLTLSELEDPLQASLAVCQYNQWMVLPLILFMCICCFGLINALIGVIVERTTAAQRNVSRLQEEADREKKMYMAKGLESTRESSFFGAGEGYIYVI